MIVYIKLSRLGKSEISLVSQSFSLIMPTKKNPLHQPEFRIVGCIDVKKMGRKEFVLRSVQCC